MDATSTSTTTPTVTVSTGTVIGKHEDGLQVFKGIPYAAPPFGANRFLAPQPHEPWSEPFEAFQFGPTAPQKEGAAPGGLPDVLEPMIAGDEVLNINVWTQSLDGSRPVLVWWHGGGYIAGNSANPWYDGASFARQGLVFVSFNYRLGAEGFMEIPGAPSNRGLLDGIAALRWVQDNIDAFGGDPARVTVMGQSAGGMAVGSVLGSKFTAGLFSQAIIASGVSRLSTWEATAAQEMTQAIADKIHVDATLEGLSSVSPADLVLAHEQIVEDFEQAGRAFGPTWAPIIDHVVIEGEFLNEIRSGLGKGIAVLVGTTKNEFAWRELRENPTSLEARRRGQKLYADAFFRQPTQEFAEARIETGAAPTFRYEFAWKSTAAPYILAGHSIDIPFFFNNLSAEYVEGYTGPNPPQSVADFDHAAFAAFARTGDPGWPPYSQGRSVMNIALEPHLSSGVEFDA